MQLALPHGRAERYIMQLALPHGRAERYAMRRRTTEYRALSLLAEQARLANVGRMHDNKACRQI